MSFVTDAFRTRLQATFTGSNQGSPEWVDALEQGTDAGFFGPGSATWSVHGGNQTIVAGVRALLVQALHPGALAGVADHSRYKEDPFGRLAGTIRWIYTVTHGDTATATSGSDWVLRLHERVRGQYVDGHGIGRPYTANDPDLARWVHLAFTDAFLRTAQRWGEPIPGGADAYVREWAIAGRLMHVHDAPETEAELRAQMDGYLDRGELAVTPRTREVLRFIKNPPLAAMLRPGYRALYQGAVSTLDSRHRALLGIRAPMLGPIELPVDRATGLVLDGITGVLGSQSGSERAALRRLERLEREAAEARAAGAVGADGGAGAAGASERGLGAV
ncbi:oxygenase MpaB family protein [Curtobacterium sp. APC 4022]|uniref:oxygenase MpaB family protein n=1 Tax=Curtobacterium sp. APC 4022 TaxID=3035201 RepID=UPI0025B4D5E2|nr:oxygenase MpaB family protein [Curtobacterium sp. APC 4022]MDN3479088.1 oxygenase MpaB family protein [Curtobacterium sp. APC 4022]